MSISNINNTVERDVEKYAFLAEWFEIESCRIRKFILFYHPDNRSISLYDTDKKRQFLKRTTMENLGPENMFVGNTMRIFGRNFKIVDYANEYTKRVLEISMQRTFAMIKPEAINRKGEILKMLISKGFQIINLRMLMLTETLIRKLYSSEIDSHGFPALLSQLTSGHVIVMELLNNNGVSKLIELTGSKFPDVARKENPETIRACFGNDELRNAFHCSLSREEAEQELNIFFNKNSLPYSEETNTFQMTHSTCCVIKPHAIREGNLGNIVFDIEQNGYKITAMQMFYLDQITAQEFLEVYQGILKEFPDMVSELSSGSCLAMEVTGPDESAPLRFRSFVGPTDPEMARQVRPNTLRAKYGKTRVQNAVHVTDLPEDALLEIEYFFKIIS